jgi:nucleoid-associated protein YgaU
MIRINTYEQTVSAPVQRKKLKLKPQVKEFFEGLLAIIFFTLIAVTIVTIIFTMIDRSNNREAFENSATTEIVVQKGESLWTIADRIEFPDVEIRDIIYKIEELNNLEGVKIYPGQVLIVPSPEG